MKYTCQVDLLAVDDTDQYWIVCHRLSMTGRIAETFIRDEEAVAACWAWEQDYLGMTIAGTIHNEVRINGSAEASQRRGHCARPAEGRRPA